MYESNIKEELQRITEELKELFELVNEDCRLDKDRYNVGVLVGIAYAKKELDKLITGINEINDETT
jgi:hypothetical protein